MSELGEANERMVGQIRVRSLPNEDRELVHPSGVRVTETKTQRDQRRERVVQQRDRLNQMIADHDTREDEWKYRDDAGGLERDGG